MIETIKVVLESNERGYKIINKDDFDPKIDKEFKAKRTPRKKKEE